MEIIIYTDNMQVCLNANSFSRYPAGVTLSSVYTDEQMDELYPAAKMATFGTDLYKSSMLASKVQVCNPVKFKKELEGARQNPNGIKVALSLTRADYDFLLYNYSGKSLMGKISRRAHEGALPGLFWEGWKELGITEEEYLKERDIEK